MVVLRPYRAEDLDALYRVNHSSSVRYFVTSSM